MPNRDLRVRANRLTSPKTSDGLVSYLFITNFSFIADKPEMEPRKDYDDYTSFINDAYAEEKTVILSKEGT